MTQVTYCVGAVISPLLANIALHMLDEAWAGGGQRLGTLVRYCDDFVVLCAARNQAEEARELAAAVLDGLGLRAHPEKTRIAHLARGVEGSGRAGGAVPVLPPVRFPDPPAEPDVPVPEHPALHRTCGGRS